MADPAYPPPPPPTYAPPDASQPPPPPPPGYQQPGQAPPPNQYGMPPPQYTSGQAPGYSTMYTSSVVAQPVATTVVINQPRGGVGFLGAMPTTTSCSHCSSTMTTRVDKKLSTQGWIWLILLCLFGCWPWCLLPLCMTGCQDYTHYCTNCGQCLGGRVSGGI